MWDDWSAIEAAQAKADADAAERLRARQEPPTPPDAAPPDPEAAAAVAEAGNIVWPHPIAPTHPGGPHPTNADGSHRDGWWSGGYWQDRPKPERVDPVTAIRLYVKQLREMFGGDLDDHD